MDNTTEVIPFHSCQTIFVFVQELDLLLSTCVSLLSFNAVDIEIQYFLSRISLHI